MFRRAVRLITVRGIELRLDPSLVLIAVLIAWTFAQRFAPSHGVMTGWTMSAVATILFFGSIVAHELGHAFEARHRGLTVNGITLFLFGGVTEMSSHSHRPRDEFAIAAVGPWISLLCAAVFGLIATGANSLLAAGLAGPLSPLLQPVGAVAGLLGWLNLALALFNLIPGAPLDGGRVLRAGLWWILGNRHRAITVTALLGQLLGLAVASFGVWLFGTTESTTLGAVWYLVIGAFLFVAARAEQRAARLDRLYAEQTVKDAFGSWLDGPVPAPTSFTTTGDHETLPRVRPDDDLHQLIDAFQGDHDVIVVDDGSQPPRMLPESHAAATLAKLRKRRR